MSSGAIIAIVIVIALIVVAAVAAVAVAQMRRARMRRQFGPEYDRLVKELGSKKADAELAARQRRADELGIRPLPAKQQAGYIDDWTTVQERFVDAPADAVNAADTLIWDVMRECGYPVDNREASLEALSVYHAGGLHGYRQVREVKLDAASTEDLRKALIRCRALFEDLLGTPADGLSTQQLTAPRPVGTAGSAR
jgi:hypothetical protein